GRAQVAGRGEDGVVGVVRVLRAVVIGVDAVVGPGGRHELHPALRSRGRGAHVLPEAALDLVDRGEDRGARRAELVLLRGRGVDREEERRGGTTAAGRGEGCHRRRDGGVLRALVVLAAVLLLPRARAARVLGGLRGLRLFRRLG